MLAGVAAGLAEYFDVDVTLVRIGLVALTLLGGAGVPLYVAAWLLIPEEGSEVAIAGEILSHSWHSLIAPDRRPHVFKGRKEMQSRWDVPWGSSPRSDQNANMRIGDAERNEISELLSKHYSDGRLDAAEFQERLDQAMSAKTRADLSGLLDDLPSLQTPEQAAGRATTPHRAGARGS